MTGLLLDPAALRARAALARAPGAPFAGLAASLARDLDPVLAAGVHVAERKARLTRAGGRCPVHGLEFAFDPFSPHAFRCDACGRAYAGDAHHEFWLYRYQLWLAERAVHAAALHALLGRPEHAAFAARVLAEAADAYPRLPDRDNVLGPGRPFFSTYLESLWLLSLCVALDLLESAGAAPGALGGRVRDRLVAPSRALVASYPEGRSNRQVWNAAALLAAARLLGDAAGAERAARGPGGVAHALRDGLLADGTWYEGDNYHQFAHRGLWYGVTMAERAGLAPDGALLARFGAGFVAPFLVALPDLTVPARRDAQYAVSLRQWRWAEWAELGLARTGDARLAGALGVLYEAGRAGGEATGRWRASGEAERNEPAAPALARDDLGWKGLLFAAPEAPPAGAWARASVLLPAQGLGILRADGGDTYAALDFGATGGGHGHPDRLNVLLQTGPHRWLDDPGTGSYVDRTLHWYRSTLAHAAPLVDERSQPPTTGRLLGWDARPGLWAAGVSAEAAVAPGGAARRTLVLCERGAARYLVDQLVWHGAGWRTVDLPLSVDADLVAGAAAPDAPLGAWRPAERPGAGGLEDGFDFLDGVEELALPPGGASLRVRPAAAPADARRLWVHAAPGAIVWRARAPGPPGRGPTMRHVVRVAAADGAGWMVLVWELAGAALAGTAVAADGTLVVRFEGGDADAHRPPAMATAAGGVSLTASDPGGWRVRRVSAVGLVEDVTLALAAAAPAAVPAPAPGEPPDLESDEPDSVPPPAEVALLEGGAPFTRTLGALHYLRSEESWEDAGRPTAHVTLAVRDDYLRFDVAVRLGRAPLFVPPDAENPLDNERAGINGDGLQLHLGLATPDVVEPVGAWLLVPVPPGDAVAVARTTRPDVAADAATPAARWAAAPGGWALSGALPLAPLRARAAALGVRPVLALDLLVNEMPAGRERRRGQLVLGGAGGRGAAAFVYLRGDRHDPARGVRLRLPPEPRPPR